MSARIISGEPVADRIKQAVKAAVDELSTTLPPKLASVLVGQNPGAVAYARMQRRACEEVGIQYELVELPETASQAEVMAAITDLNTREDVTAIIVQMPLPEHVDARAVQRMIDPAKDADGVHPLNLGHVVQGRMRQAPCTAQAVMELLREAEVQLHGAEVVMVGHSEIVGKPTALLLLDQLATVTVCHIGTKDLKAHTSRAEILIVAVGKPGLITADMVKPGAVVIDVGINRVKDPQTGKSRIVGDVDFDAVKEVAGAITPVPGGVGPVTTAVLLRNVIDATRLQVEMRAG